MAKSDLEESFLAGYLRMQQVMNIRLPYPEREYKFCSGRRWRFDFAWPDVQVAVEIDGGIWSGGAHANPQGLIRSYDKSNAAVVRGWKVLRFSSNHLSDPHAVFDMLLQAMGFFGDMDEDDDVSRD